MHLLRPAFAMSDADALDLAERRGFGLVVAHDGQRPVASHLPFVVTRQPAGPVVRFHVTGANPLAELADGQRQFLLAVTGPDVYVSNDWYASKDQVSTWLYEAVHLSGPARRLEIADNRHHGDAVLQRFEADLAPKPAWRLEAMEAAKRAAMLDAIVVIELAVVSIESQRKLNQHKPDADHIAVVRALERTGSQAAQEIARRMRSLRPHLDRDGELPGD